MHPIIKSISIHQEKPMVTAAWRIMKPEGTKVQINVTLLSKLEF